jgi:hypothetical protein
MRVILVRTRRKRKCEINLPDANETLILVNAKIIRTQFSHSFTKVKELSAIEGLICE